jgi:hypothetical protein
MESASSEDRQVERVRLRLIRELFLLICSLLPSPHINVKVQLKQYRHGFLSTITRFINEHLHPVCALRC